MEILKPIIIDGTEKVAKETNPAFEDNPDYDEAKEPKDKEDKAPEGADDSDDSEESEELDEIGLEDLDEDTEDKEDKDKEDAPKDSEDKEEKEDSEESKNIEKPDSAPLTENRNELRRMHRQFDVLMRRREALKEPTPPKKNEYGEIDESAQRTYEVRLASWEDRQEALVAEHESLKQDMWAVAKEQEKLFRQNHKGEDINEFEQFMKDKDHYYYAYINGNESLEDIYNIYQLTEGKKKKDSKETETIKKAGARIEKIDTKTKGVSSYGGNGLPSKFKYSNMRVFRDMVKDMQKRKTGIDGRRFTNDRIEKLCKQEYMQMKGVPLVK